MISIISISVDTRNLTLMILVVKKMKTTILITLCCILFNISTAYNGKSVISDKEDDGNDLIDLLKFALLSEDNHAEANQIYFQKYGQFPVEITHMSTNIFFWNKRLLVKYDLAEKFLRAFGRSIQSLTIAFVSIPFIRHRQMVKYANEYCFETLMEFNLKMCTKDVFVDIQKPFQMVKTLVLGGDFPEQSVNSTVPLNKLFPEIYRLTVDSDTNGYILGLNYSNLTELNIMSPSLEYAKLIENNQQIRKIKLIDGSTEFIEIVQNKLKNLETLIFNVPKDLPQYRGSTIQFDGVKKLVIIDLYRNFRNDKIAFNHLDCFELLIDKYVDDEWIKFFEKTGGQKTIKLSIGNINDSTIPKLPTNLEGFIEVAIGCQIDEIDGLIDFLKKNRHCKNLSLNCPRASTTFFEQLAKRLDKRWKIGKSCLITTA